MEGDQTGRKDPQAAPVNENAQKERRAYGPSCIDQQGGSKGRQEGLISEKVQYETTSLWSLDRRIII